MSCRVEKQISEQEGNNQHSHYHGYNNFPYHGMLYHYANSNGANIKNGKNTDHPKIAKITLTIHMITAQSLYFLAAAYPFSSYLELTCAANIIAMIPVIWQQKMVHKIAQIRLFDGHGRSWF